MANNRLTDKIDDYSIDWGIQFDETYTANTPPVQFGTLAPVSSLNWTFDNVNNGLSSESGIGPFPGQNSWKTKSGGGNTAGRLQHGSSSSQQSWGDIIRSCNYTYGIWIKFNTLPLVSQVGVVRTLNLQVAGSPSTWYSGFYIGIGQATIGGTKLLSFITQGQTLFNPDAAEELILDKWYYLAIRKTKNDSNNTVDVQIFIDGNEVNTFNAPFYDDVVTFTNWGFQGTNPNFVHDMNIANMHLASNTVLDATAIAAIWDAGAPIQVPVRHYDGTDWQDSSDQKIWDGTKWIPMYANRWDGTNWVAI
jgi:hypothetical protein